MKGTVAGLIGVTAVLGTWITQGKIYHSMAGIDVPASDNYFFAIIIGESLITNSDQRARFIVEGNAPILREKDILTAETANTPVKRIYLCVQMMYLENDIAKYQALYFDFVKDLLAAAPSCRKQIESASNHILSGSFYKALKDIKKLMNREATLLGN